MQGAWDQSEMSLVKDKHNIVNQLYSTKLLKNLLYQKKDKWRHIKHFRSLFEQKLIQIGWHQIRRGYVLHQRELGKISIEKR